MRWVICPVIGSGTDQDPYRAKVADYGSHVALIPGNTDGTPQSTWAICGVGDDTLTAIDSDSECQLLPDIALEDVVTPDLIPVGKGTVDQPNLTAWITLQENIENIGQQIDPAFTADWMNLG